MILTFYLNENIPLYLRQDLSFSVYDNDPLSSLRKRRVSTDSHDSGASHPGDLRAGMENVRKTAASSSLSLPQASKLTESSFPTEKKRTKSGASSSGGEKVKAKKHKKHKHSHKHKSHKRHRSGEKEKEFKEARTKYAVRSPVRAVEELSRGFTEDKEEAGESSESEAEEQYTQHQVNTRLSFGQY